MIAGQPVRALARSEMRSQLAYGGGANATNLKQIQIIHHLQMFGTTHTGGKQRLGN
jgi:hypothetical protein